ncbi:galactokinase [Aggregatibacter actinomycetemcomitans]|uniref:Galactokinase n=1 Tax=Aggregatibacter actinomycetemcomitans TaxID=714 RepID=A0AB74N6J6_AGGAC|nr:galactokinase [Aggregatibacter actinomycetemcomitans]TYA39616.1 galactokinase [Aggregatibacter actinomycetemcomitans]TYB11216.1 galactokinase [Aggregatibacter actinomycetemcomitans]
MLPIEKSQYIFTQKHHKQSELIVYAPGRVNIIGEHTDYNDGFVMPCAINYGTAIAGAKRSDHIWNVYAADLDLSDEFSLDSQLPQSEQKWANYVRGVVKFIQERCPNFKQGADLVISGNVPHSSGLSSSAALEVATGKFCQQLGDLPLSHTELALIGQQDHLLMIDCRSLETLPTPVPHDVAVIIVNSNVPHDLVTGEYNTRRQQCECAAAFFGVKALRDVSVAQFKEREAELTALDPLAAKRARHVVTENQRVLDAVDALKRNDLTRLGELMGQSHDSMRDDFEITVPQIDYLVELVQLVIGKNGGARMTGGGFGGCIVALAPHDKVGAVRKIIAENYEKQTDLKEDFYVCTASQGVRVC